LCYNSINNDVGNNVYIQKNESLQTLWPADRVYLCTSYVQVILICLSTLEKLLN